VRQIALAEADCLPDEQADALAGTLLGDDSYDRLVAGEDATVLRPDGSPLLVLRRNALPLALCEAGYHALRGAANETDNRGLAAGLNTDGRAKSYPMKRDGTISNTNTSKTRLHLVPDGKTRTGQYAIVKKDGTLSAQNRALPIQSGVVGYFDRSARFPYCRQTAFTIAEADKFAAALPLVRAIDAVFAEAVPDRYAAQRARADATPADFVIAGTAFTTITVNRNWQTAVHKDAGDLREGFGCLVALRAGKFDGCHLVFPKYRTAVDLRTRDVLLCDFHEWHGNSPIRGVPGAFERLSLVFYYREHMAACGTAAEELERAKRRKPGTPLRDRNGGPA
jgi:hypothetical protein